VIINIFVLTFKKFLEGSGQVGFDLPEKSLFEVSFTYDTKHYTKTVKATSTNPDEAIGKAVAIVFKEKKLENEIGLAIHKIKKNLKI